MAPPALALSASTDAGTALGLIDQVQFAALHVTRVSAQIQAERGPRKAFSAVAVYDGLELKIKGHKARHVYRDPAMLITGSASLTFRVANK